MMTLFDADDDIVWLWCTMILFDDDDNADDNDNDVWCMIVMYDCYVR